MAEVSNLLKEISREGVPKEQVLLFYEERATLYDNDMVIVKAEFHNQITRAALEYCPGSPISAKVLDVGAGTGLVGKELNSLGFIHIDGVDPSSESLREAETKKVYNKLMCQYFTREPLDIPDNYYDMIVTCGTVIEGHLPCDCLYEMIRLVRQGETCTANTLNVAPVYESVSEILMFSAFIVNELVFKGGIICIVTRASIFNDVTTPAYKVLPLIKELERNGSLRRLKWEAPVPYCNGVEGISLVFEVL